jgi:hypothetical protein
MDADDYDDHSLFVNDDGGIGSRRGSPAAMNDELAEGSDTGGPEYTDADRAAWKERIGFRQEIETIIGKYAASTEKPPFITPELIVMVVLCSDGEFMDHGQIMASILHTFRYYGQKAINHYLQLRHDCVQPPHPSRSKYSTPFPVDFAASFKLWNVPVTDVTIRGLGQDMMVPVGAGRIFFVEVACSSSRRDLPVSRSAGRIAQPNL